MPLIIVYTYFNLLSVNKYKGEKVNFFTMSISSSLLFLTISWATSLTLAMKCKSSMNHFECRDRKSFVRLGAILCSLFNHKQEFQTTAVKNQSLTTDQILHPNLQGSFGIMWTTCEVSMMWEFCSE